MNIVNSNLEMKTIHILKLLIAFAWLVFVGLCVKTGAMLMSTVLSSASGNEAFSILYADLDLSEVYVYSSAAYYFLILCLLLSSLSQAIILFFVIKACSKVDVQNPFSEYVSRILTKISYLALVVGVSSLIGSAVSKWLAEHGLNANIEWSADAYIFMACVLFLIAMFFKRGVEIQKENQLTI